LSQNLTEMCRRVQLDLIFFGEVENPRRGNLQFWFSYLTASSFTKLGMDFSIDVDEASVTWRIPSCVPACVWD